MLIFLNVRTIFAFRFFLLKFDTVLNDCAMANSPKMDLNQLVSKNQSIKIVPSVEDSLKEIGLNVELDNNTQLWFDQLKLTWQTWKKSPTVENHITVFFSSIPDPHRVALIFIIKYDGLKDCKQKSFPYFIIETLQKWAQVNNVVPDESLKLPAFRIAIQQKNQHFLCLMVKTFYMNSIKNLILPVVRAMIKEDNCRQASQVIIAMELFDDIPVEDLLFPLILQDKTNVIDDHLSECPHKVKQLLQFLDRLLDKNFNIREYVQKYIEENKVGHIKYEKLHYKPLGKLVARLCNKFNVPIETCKNLSKNRTTGGLRYLVHQKYQENNVSSAVWDDLVKDSLRQCADSAKEFIDLLVDYDKKEALKWAEYLKISEADLPLALKDMSLDTKQEDENWDTSSSMQAATPQSFYKLSLPTDQIIMIDSAEKFYDLMMSNLIGCNVVSIDCEWKPSFGATQQQVALIQIATLGQVYLIDTIVLNKPEYSSFWYKFHKAFLDNAEIIKVGFGLEVDLKEIKASVSGLSNIKIKGEGLLDMCLLWKTLIESGLIIPGNSGAGGSSLSTLVQSCFGAPLEKSEQCSNWELRPLRKTQIMYAALDAYVLLEIYYYLQQLCHQQGINYEEICNSVMLEGKKKSVKKSKPSETIIKEESNEKVFAKDTKFLVDPSVSPLMTYLRYCGIDTAVMSSTMLWHDVINTAISEDRLILLPKLKCSSTTNYPQASILDVGKGTIKDQLKKVFTNFNIVVRDEDLLSICVYCNSKNINKMMPNEVNKLCAEYQTANKVKLNYQRDSDDDDDFKNFLSDSDCDDDYMQPVSSVNYGFKDCKTSKGAVLQISDIQRLMESQKSAVLCDDCGRLLWDEDPLIQMAKNMIPSVTKITFE